MRTTDPDVTSIQDKTVEGGETYEYGIQAFRKSASANITLTSDMVQLTYKMPSLSYCPACMLAQLMNSGKGNGNPVQADADNGTSATGASAETSVSITGGGSWGEGQFLSNSGSAGGGASSTSTPTLRCLHNGDYVMTIGSYRVYFASSYSGYPGNPFTMDLNSSTGFLEIKDDQGDILGFDAPAAGEVGKFQFYTDADGNTITASYPSGTSTIITEPLSNGTMQHYNYSYDTSGTLLGVTLTNNSNTTPTQSLNYAYYNSNGSNGNTGDVKTVTLATDTGETSVSYMRYYPNTSSGGPDLIKYIVTGAAYDALVAANGTDLDSLSDSTVAAFADHYYEYDSAGRVTKDVSAGTGCSNCSGGFGTTLFFYAISNNADGFNNWKFRRTEYLPGYDFNNPTAPQNTEVITYANYLGQTMLRVTINGAGQEWLDYYRYDSNGNQILHATPAAVSSYSDSLADLVSFGNANCTLKSTGLIEYTDYYSGTSATTTSAGSVDGYLEDTAISDGYNSTKHYLTFANYIGNSVNGTTYYQRSNQTQFAGDLTVDPATADSTTFAAALPRTTHYDYTWATNTTQVLSVTTSAPVVSASQNGPGIADTTKVYNDSLGRPIWSMDGKGNISYQEYDPATGAVVKSITDVNYASLSTDEQASLDGTGWVHHDSGLNLVTVYTPDSQGRTKEEKDPNGNYTYTLYDDADHAVFTFAGATESVDASGNGTLTLPTGSPITMTRTGLNYANGTYDETMTLSTTGAIAVVNGVIQMPGFTGTGNTLLNLVGNGTSASPQYTVHSLSRTLYNFAQQAIESDAYASITNSVYLGTSANSPYSGSSGTNYNATFYGYDSQGRQKYTITPSGTINFTVYDALGRIASSWVGTNDIDFTNTDPTGGTTGQAAGNNMQMVASYQYDNGGVGDGNLTEEIQYPDSSVADERITQSVYDWRDRLVTTKQGSSSNGTASETDGAHRPISINILDNADEVTASYTFDGDGIALTDSNGDGVPDALAAYLVAPGQTAATPTLTSYSSENYDAQGRVYQSTVFSVAPNTSNPSCMTISSSGIVTNAFFDQNGNVVDTHTSGGVTTKTTYDGANRATVVYTTDGGGDTSWSDALNVTGDTVLEQVEYTYDANGNVIETADLQRFSDATGTGALGDPSSSQPKARVYYTVAYYDALNRQTFSVNVGTNGGSTYTRPSTPPSRSNTTLVTSYTYNAAGLQDVAVDPSGHWSKTIYDNLGQTLYTIAAWDASYDPTSSALPPSQDADQTTKYTYDGDGHMVTMTAVMPSGQDSQTTQYVYGVTAADGSTINSNDILRLVEYPDPSTGAASTSSSGQNTYTYDALGDVLTKTDQNGSVHTYSYDSLGRQTLDSVTTLASGVDGAVRAIGTTYNAQGLSETITSYSTTTADSAHVVNQVENLYNGFGQLAQQFQEQIGAVSNFTLSVQYAYGTPEEGSRLASMTYPNGTVLTYSYGASGSLNDTISRLDALAEGNQTLESYQYLGLSSVVVREQPQAGMELTYVQQSGDANANTDGGDQYTGLDRFGRVLDQNWINTSNGTTLDRYQYAYDRDGNVTAKTNLLDSSLSETYTYNDLNQLANMTRGGSAYQSWSLDALGNMQSVTTSGTTQNRTTNDQNELTGVGTSTLTYDHDGNTLTDDQGHTLVYDAWNRLVGANDGGEQYEYDGTGHRIKESDFGARTDTFLYYSNQWQVIEERQDDQGASINTIAQEVWSPVYVNALVLRDANTTGDPATDGLNQRVYAIQDANYNVTGLVAQSGTPATWQVVQREAYDSYGNVQTLNASWSSTTDAYNWNYLFQGGRYSAAAGLYTFQHRDYSPTMMRWASNDPAGYVDGLNTYQFVSGNPIDGIDPSGLKRVVFAFEGLGGFNNGEKQKVLGDPTGDTSPAQEPGNASYPFLLELLREAHLTTDKNTVVNYYAQNSVDSAVQEARKVAKGCDTILTVGFSNGGDAAIQFAGNLRHYKIKVDLGYTVDPVPKGLGLFTRLFVDFTKPSNAAKWINYYQKVPGTLGIVGHSVTGADIDKDVSSRVTALMILAGFDPAHLSLQQGLVGGHLFITKLDDPVVQGLHKAVLAVPITRKK